MGRLRKIFSPNDYVTKGSKKGFEGWYFKCTLRDKSFAFIVGICHEKNDRHSFIQYIDSLRSHYFRFDYGDFGYSREKSEVYIGENKFSKNGIAASLKDNILEVACNVEFNQQIYYQKSLLNPTSMGPLSYLPMFCSHTIIMLNAVSNGHLAINGFKITGVGNAYIEKDSGLTFPKNYVWIYSGGQYKNADGEKSTFCFSFACAEPVIFNKRGHICLVHFLDKQYNFSSYTFSKLDLKVVSDESQANDGNQVAAILTSGKNSVEISVSFNKISSQKLVAPCALGMKTHIHENISATADIKLNLHNVKANFSLPAAIEIASAEQ